MNKEEKTKLKSKISTYWSVVADIDDLIGKMHEASSGSDTVSAFIVLRAYYTRLAKLSTITLKEN